METRAANWRLLAVPLGFALVCVLLAILIWRAFGGAVPLEPQGYRVTIPLPRATNLHSGADVRAAGITIGRVVDVDLRHRSAPATIELEQRYAPLRRDARAILRTKTLLGEAYVELTLGSPGARPIADGGTLAARRVAPTQSFDEVLETFDPATRAHARRLLAGLERGLRGRAPAFNAALGELAPLTADAGALLAQLDRQRGDLRRIVSHGAGMLSVLGEQQGALQAAVRGADAVLSTTAARNRALGATVAALPPLLGELRRTSGTLTAAAGDLDRATAELRATAPRVGPALAAIDALAPQASGVFTQLRPTLRAARRGLPRVPPLLASARPALRRLYPATRELIPVTQLLSESADAIVASFANVAASYGTQVGPGGRVVGYAGGIPTIWNSAIAGWKQKLPSNRSNPYPKPGSALDIARGGLKSFDCRHVGNTAWLPPLLSTPPCREQGPWTFNGVSAYFPRLRPAPP